MAVASPIGQTSIANRWLLVAIPRKEQNMLPVGTGTWLLKYDWTTRLF